MTAQPPATPMVLAGRGPDRRVTNADGEPVRWRQARSDGGWWFRVRRSPGPTGVELIARIPGWNQEAVITQHASQEDADLAARAAYDEYRAAVDAAVNGAHSAQQEAS
jgi:hypothetical protein